jgi:hypothetical protein
MDITRYIGSLKTAVVQRVNVSENKLVFEKLLRG